MKTVTKSNALQNIYTEYIIDFVLEVSLIVGGWIALIIGSFSVEIADVLTQTATAITDTLIVNNQNETASIDLWIKRIGNISFFMISNYVVLILYIF